MAYLNSLKFALHEVIIEILADDVSPLPSIVFDAFQGPQLQTRAKLGDGLGGSIGPVSDDVVNTRSEVPVNI